MAKFRKETEEIEIVEEDVKVEAILEEKLNKDGAPIGRPLTEKEYIALKNKK